MNKGQEKNVLNANGWQIVFFSSTRAVSTLFTVLLTFISYMAAGGYGIAVAVAGTIATATRLLDGITDPVMAFIGDRIVTRYGRVRIMMASGFAIMFLSLATIFFWGVGGSPVIYVVAYVFYVIGNTLFTVGADTGHVILTKDLTQRAKVGRYGTFFTVIFTAVLSVYNANYLIPKYGGLTQEALQNLCMVVLGTTAAMVVMCLAAISEKDVPGNLKVGKEHVSLKACWSMLKGNVPLRCFIVSFASDQIAQQAASQSAVVIMVFGVIIGNYSFRGNLSLIELVPTLLMVFFATRFAGKNGTAKELVRWTWICMLLSVVMVGYMAIIDTRQISVSVVHTAIFLLIDVLFVAARGAVTACTNAIRPDITDYELYRADTFMPSTVAAVISFTNKVVSSLSTTIVGFCLAGIGYVTAMPQPSDELTTSVFWMGMFLWMGLPFLGWLCTVIAMRFYKLDKEKMEEIQRANAQKRKMNGQAS